MPDQMKLLPEDADADVESHIRPAGKPRCPADREEFPWEGCDEELAITGPLGSVRQMAVQEPRTSMYLALDAVHINSVGSLIKSRASLCAAIALVVTGILGLAIVLLGLPGETMLSWRGTASQNEAELTGVTLVTPKNVWVAPHTGLSLFCFSVMQPGTAEETLLEYQIKRRASIFACDEFAVISPKNKTLSKGNGNIVTWYNPASDVGIGDLTQAGVNTNSWLNTVTFIEAFDTLVKSKRIFKYDFLVKVDPDAVFFPDRLRMHLAPHVGKSIYVANCNMYYSMNPVGPKVFGAIEIYSKAAMQAYERGGASCMNRDWHGWGEDYYMQTCMNMLGVGMETDFKLIGDNRCVFAPCTDASRVAYHPFKDLGSYQACFKHAIGEIA